MDGLGFRGLGRLGPPPSRTGMMGIERGPKPKAPIVVQGFGGFMGYPTGSSTQ